MSAPSLLTCPRPTARAEGVQHRTDIQGLRALAVSLVLLYHLWPGRLPGGFTGVDVFFVISGFLITSHLLTRSPRTPRDLVDFWARRARRLLPASLLVLLVTLVATWILDVRQLWESTAQDAIAAALYVQNWNLAHRSVDYLGAEEAPSPFQHYWSLSLEEQFYVLWPVVILVVGLLATRLRTRELPAVAGAMAACVAVSFVVSVLMTGRDPAQAYFVTPTRIWELGAGGLLAAWGLHRSGRAAVSAPGRSGPSPRGRVVLAWSGVAAVVAGAFLITPSTPFPGSMALVPVLGTAAVIAAAAPRTAGSPRRLSDLPVVQWLGDVSYPVYLWHWPLITLVPYVSGGRAGTLDKVVVILASLALAQLTKRYVEDPIRKAPIGGASGRVLALSAAGMVVVVLAGAGLIVTAREARDAARADLTAALASADPCLGAAAMADGGRCGRTTHGPVLPEPALARADRSDAYEHDCWEDNPWSGMHTCTFGPADADTSVALVGNSHAGHWLPAIQAVAEERGWRVTTFLASECPATTLPAAFLDTETTAGCVGWGRRVLEATAGDAFDLVITSERTIAQRYETTAVSTAAQLRSGYEQYLTDWVDAGTDLLILRDTPVPGRTIGAVPECVTKFIDDLLQCSGTPAQWMPPDPLAEAAVDVGIGDSVVDLTGYFCRDDLCPAVIGGVVVYYDQHHMTATFARTLAPYLAGPLLDRLAAE